MNGSFGNSKATHLRVYSDHTLSRLKNIGVAWSEQHFGRGDWLYLSDSDVYFTEGWLDVLTYAAQRTEDQGFKLWGGQCHPFHQPISSSGVELKSKGIDCPDRLLGTVLEHEILDGPSWLMRWQTWDNHGPLKRDTAPGPCQSEEYPFCTSLLSEGHIGVIQPHVVYHTGLTNSRGEDAPGRKERMARATHTETVLYE